MRLSAHNQSLTLWSPFKCGGMPRHFIGCCRTARKKQRVIMRNFYCWINQNRGQRLGEFLQSPKRKLAGFANYFGVPDNSRSLSRLYGYVARSLCKLLNRRSQCRGYNWAGLKEVLMHFGIRPPRVWKRTHVVVDWY